jgi:hypothetical protein
MSKQDILSMVTSISDKHGSTSDSLYRSGTTRNAATITPKDKNDMFTGFHELGNKFPVQIVFYHDDCIDGTMSKASWHQGLVWAGAHNRVHTEAAFEELSLVDPFSAKQLVEGAAPYTVTELSPRLRNHLNDILPPCRFNVQVVRYKRWYPELNSDVDWEREEFCNTVIYAPISYAFTSKLITKYIDALETAFTDEDVESLEHFADSLVAFVDYAPPITLDETPVDYSLNSMGKVVILDHHKGVAEKIQQYVSMTDSNPYAGAHVFIADGLSGAAMTYDMLVGIYSTQRTGDTYPDIFIDHILKDNQTFNELKYGPTNLIDRVSALDTHNGRYDVGGDFARGINNFSAELNDLDQLATVYDDLLAFGSEVATADNMCSAFTLVGDMLNKTHYTYVSSLIEHAMHVSLGMRAVEDKSCETTLEIIPPVGAYSETNEITACVFDKILKREDVLQVGDCSLTSLDAEFLSARSLRVLALHNVLTAFTDSKFMVDSVVETMIVAAPLSFRGVAPHALNEKYDTRCSFSYAIISPTMVKWSVRSSKKGVDCVILSRLLDGGGHAGAAGFHTPTFVEPQLLLVWILAKELERVSKEHLRNFPETHSLHYSGIVDMADPRTTFFRMVETARLDIERAAADPG